MERDTNAGDPTAFVSVVINGPAKALPRIPDDRVTILRRTNDCFDFGAWRTALDDFRKRVGEPGAVILLNASVRGPFLPPFASSTSWVDGFLGLLRDDVALASVAVNCPDGKGRPWPHVTGPGGRGNPKTRRRGAFLSGAA